MIQLKKRRYCGGKQRKEVQEHKERLWGKRYLNKTRNMTVFDLTPVGASFFPLFSSSTVFFPEMGINILLLFLVVLLIGCA